MDSCDLASLPYTEAEFGVVDVETTGLFPQRYDRIIEIAVLRVHPDGRVADQYVTLVNPGRDISAREIHGLTATDLRDAPRFNDIAGDVLDRLAGTVVCGHNVRFDTSFLRSECRRLEMALPDFAALCTLSLATEYGFSRSLADCCVQLGIDLQDAHCAQHDAEATVALLAALLQLGAEEGRRTLGELGCIGSLLSRESWPPCARSGRAICRRQAARMRAAEPSYLGQLVARLMRVPSQTRQSSQVQGYLALLDRVLEDRIVSQCEHDGLLVFAQEWGLSGAAVLDAHQRYLEDLVDLALADAILSDLERADLLEVCRLLGFDQAKLDSVIDLARGRTGERKTNLGDSHPLLGKRVCFTGTSICCRNGEPIGRETAEQLVVAAGLVVAPSVTKALDILVVADPNTLSGKAQKARRYGTRIIAEPVFWRTIGVPVD